MTMSEKFKDLEKHNRIPRFFLVFFFALIAWGVWYIAAYTPQISGWSQYDVLKKEVEAEKKASLVGMVENPYERDSKAIDEGRGIYKEHCSGCHGGGLKGEVGPDLTDHLAFGETDDAKFESIAKGRPGGMPSFGDSLGRDRIWKVLAYVDSVREYKGKP
jgi:cytochrome c oxidase cbb3-type subunit 3